jgi:hypothetical protein
VKAYILSDRIRAAEVAEIQAEDKLLDIAISKLEVDEVVQKVDKVLTRLLDQFDLLNPKQIKEMITKLRKQTSGEGEGARNSAFRFSIMLSETSTFLYK